MCAPPNGLPRTAASAIRHGHRRPEEADFAGSNVTWSTQRPALAETALGVVSSIERLEVRQ